MFTVALVALTSLFIVIHSCAEHPCSKTSKGLKLPQKIEEKKKFTITYSYSIEFVVSFISSCVCVMLPRLPLSTEFLVEYVVMHVQ